jgi:hypothetical protein
MSEHEKTTKLVHRAWKGTAVGLTLFLATAGLVIVNTGFTTIRSTAAESAAVQISSAASGTCQSPSPTAAPTAAPTPSSILGGTGTSCTTTFTVSGSDTPPPDRNQREKQDTGSPEDAKACETPRGQYAFKTDEAIGQEIVGGWGTIHLTTAAQLLANFLSGSGAEVDYPATSDAADEVKATSVFTEMNNRILSYVLGQAVGGATQINVPTSAGLLHTLGFTGVAPLSELDLHWALRYTHGITLQGSGTVQGDDYSGSLTYVISESYGFNTGNTLEYAGIQFGSAMRYLQTVCGAPYYPGGPHWFPVTIAVTVPFEFKVA